MPSRWRRRDAWASRSSTSVRFGRSVERVVQGRVPSRLLLAVTFDGDRDQRGDRAQERHLVVGERAPAPRPHVQDTERLAVAADRDAHAADDAHLQEERRRLEAGLRGHVVDDGRLLVAERVAGVRALAHGELVGADHAIGKADAGDDGQRLSVFAELEDAPAVDAQRGGRGRDRLGHQQAEVASLEGEAAELGDCLLVAGVTGDLLCGVGQLRDVARDDEHRLHGVVIPAHGNRLNRERQAFAQELEAAALAVQRGAIGRERQIQDLGGDHRLEVGHQPALELVLLGPRKAPDGLAVGDHDPQVAIEQEHTRVREVCREDAVQLIGAADCLCVCDRGRSAVGDVLGDEVQDAVLRDARPVEQPVVPGAGAVAVLEGDPRLAARPRNRSAICTVASMSSGWTKDRNGSAMSSSSDQPRTPSRPGSAG